MMARVTWYFPNGSSLVLNQIGNDPSHYQSSNVKGFQMNELEQINLMTPTEYDRLAAKTDLDEIQYEKAKIRAAAQIELLHASMGISTEAGEFVDSLKKYILYGKAIDPVNLVEELGDLFWYISLALRELEVPWEEVMRINIEKLKARYGDKFTEEAALNRDLDNERRILEGK